MQKETVQVIWKTFAEEMPKGYAAIYVCSPKGDFLSAELTSLREDVLGQTWSFMYKQQIYNVWKYRHKDIKINKRILDWKWCYYDYIRTNHCIIYKG